MTFMTQFFLPRLPGLHSPLPLFLDQSVSPFLSTVLVSSKYYSPRHRRSDPRGHVAGWLAASPIEAGALLQQQPW